MTEENLIKDDDVLSVLDIEISEPSPQRDFFERVPNPRSRFSLALGQSAVEAALLAYREGNTKQAKQAGFAPI